MSKNSEPTCNKEFLETYLRRLAIGPTVTDPAGLFRPVRDKAHYYLCRFYEAGTWAMLKALMTHVDEAFKTGEWDKLAEYMRTWNDGQ